jgi:putative PIN family toxin of toxin-antitoxin system
VRVLLDSSVLIAAFATRGLCHDVFETCLTDHVIIVSDELLDEVRRNLLRKLLLTETVADGVVGLLRAQGEPHRPTAVEKGACRDASDNHILGLALASKCDCIVTGDDDLRVLKKFRGIEILGPRQFWERLRASGA